MDILKDIYQEIFFKPLFNGLIFLTNILPFHDLGAAIILLTLFVRFVIFPFTHRSIVTQIKMKEIEPHINHIREKYKNNQQELAQKTMELYKQHGVSPFSGCIMVIVQFPVLIALYQIFIHEISPHTNLLYSFVHSPGAIHTVFLGFINLTEANIVLAICAGLSQFIQMRLAIPRIKGDGIKKETNPRVPDFSKTFMKQAQYIFPAVVIFIALRFPAALGLYWTTSNIFAILHESIVRKKAKTLYGQGKTDKGSGNNSIPH